MAKAFVIDQKIMRRILQNPDKRSKQGLRDYAVLLVLSLGLRRQEVCNLNHGHFDPGLGYLYIMTLKHGKNRTIKLTAEIVAAIEAYRASKQNGTQRMENVEALFHTTGKFGPWPMKRLTPMAINGLVNRVLKKAGVNGQRITPHSFRHNCATTMLRQGRDLKTIQQVLGHRSIATTSMYLHALDVDAAFTGLPWLKKKRGAA